MLSFIFFFTFLHSSHALVLPKPDAGSSPRRLISENDADRASGAVGWSVGPSADGCASGSPVTSSRRLWKPKNEEACDLPPTSPDRPVPGYLSKRILIVFWKQAYRGPKGFLNLVTKGCADGKPGSFSLDKEIVCGPEAELMQRAVTKSHLENLIMPLEAVNFTVDVMLSNTESCGYQNNQTKDRLKQNLQDWYNEDTGSTLKGRKRIIRTTSALKGRSQLESSADAAKDILELLGKSQHSYESILLWRFDVAALDRLVSPGWTRNETVPVMRDVGIGQNKSDRKYGGSSYLTWNHDFAAKVADLSYSVPGYMASCVLRPLAEKCVGNFSGMKSQSNEWSGCFQSNNQEWHYGDVLMPPMMIARGPVGDFHCSRVLPSSACKVLHERFGGPPCNPGRLADIACQKLCPRLVEHRNYNSTRDCMAQFWKNYDFDQNIVRNKWPKEPPLEEDGGARLMCE